MSFRYFHSQLACGKHLESKAHLVVTAAAAAFGCQANEALHAEVFNCLDSWQLSWRHPLAFFLSRVRKGPTSFQLVLAAALQKCHLDFFVLTFLDRFLLQFFFICANLLVLAAMERKSQYYIDALVLLVLRELRGEPRSRTVRWLCWNVWSVLRPKLRVWMFTNMFDLIGIITYLLSNLAILLIYQTFNLVYHVLVI